MLRDAAGKIPWKSVNVVEENLCFQCDSNGMNTSSGEFDAAARRDSGSERRQAEEVRVVHSAQLEGPTTDSANFLGSGTLEGSGCSCWRGWSQELGRQRELRPDGREKVAMGSGATESGMLQCLTQNLWLE